MTTSSMKLILAVRSIVFLSVRMYCRSTSRRLNIIVKFPRENCGNTRERLYGIDVMGDVPMDAFVMNPIAIEMQNRPMPNTR